jgi:NDP-sugar pyrophosphorylase family protein
LLLGHLGEQVERFAGNGAEYGLRIRCSYESKPLGTGGAVKNAEHLLSKTFLVLNGDTFAELHLNDLFEYHLQNCSTVATIALCEIDDISDFGNVVITSHSEIVRFEEKQNIHRKGLANAGVYCFSNIIFDHILSDTKYSLETQLFESLLVSGMLVRGYRFPAAFLDIGTPERLRQAQLHPGFLDHPAGPQP